MSVLSDILRTKLIPWAQLDADKRFIVARSAMSDVKLPAEAHLDRRSIAGKRVVVKNRRNYKNTRNIVAEWPEDGLHELNKYALVCVLAGRIDYALGNYKLQCGAGNFIFIPPGTPHPNGTRSYVDLQKSTSCDLITFLLHPNALECWLSHGHAEGRGRNNYCLILHSRVISVFQALMEEVVEGEPRASVIGAELLSAFLNLLFREVEAGRLQSLRIWSPNHQNETTVETTETDFATRLEHYVQANLRKSLTLEIVSQDMYLSPAQFARNVRRETGESFNQFLARHRLEEAKTLLTNSEWTISAVAGLVGFRSASYFCTFFKQHSGETPSEFRARFPKSLSNPKDARIFKSVIE